MKIILSILLLFIITCAKEKSCEGCYEPIDSIPKTYVIYYEIPVENNDQLTSLEPQFKSKYRDWYNFTSLPVIDDSLFIIYKDSLDVGDEMQPLLTGDTALVKFELGWRDGTKTYTEIIDTLIK